jgi:hypothetical protein
MPPPLHVEAFQKINDEIEDHLEASIAFAAFLRSERDWVRNQPAEPTESKYRAFHDNVLTGHLIGYLRDEARRTLGDYATKVIGLERDKFLNEALSAYQESAELGHAKFRRWGIAEATLGAFSWTVLLIVVSVVLAWTGIDVFEYYQKAKNVVPH